jgi:hypothetical protein
MNRTSSQSERQELLSVGANRARPDRRRWIFGGLAAAVAAAVGVVLWTSGPGTQRGSPPAARPTGSSAATNLAAAEGMAAAFAAHDSAGAASYLARGTAMPDWVGPVIVKRDAAWAVRYLMQPCRATSTYPNLTVFSCPFGVHLLGSSDVGKGPFRNNTLAVDVSDGKVTSANVLMPYETNGIGRYLGSVFGWIAENHPSDRRFLHQDEADVTPAEWPRYTYLWKQYVREYVAATIDAG